MSQLRYQDLTPELRLVYDSMQRRLRALRATIGLLYRVTASTKKFSPAVRARANKKLARARLEKDHLDKDSLALLDREAWRDKEKDAQNRFEAEDGFRAREKNKIQPNAPGGSWNNKNR